ncbi:hypothetical protein SAMD00019534_081940 [Acytostelium subglobosum LB1]|uniref:hypothetical protein n=1 Tax=Acytostelium subglobosum LB1 TaxID=1410327 RepID=UPI00064499E8|nr:hypothetical protein SAMD00019534_081940 [Acytostelium subglobosum LB1]GAM25019.1 hypothetical protein SAMD00019534_081940 [Acytostelium subglobosum LB1]|eukprot:XP_012752108.1 hypothetical protein SAMD00019534_081940 [Acytostelium subglobosum LB1]
MGRSQYNNRHRGGGGSRFSKINYLNVTLFTSLAVLFLLNMVSLVLETKEEFQVKRVLSLLYKEYYDTSISDSLSSIHTQLHIVMISSIFIMVLLCVAFVAISLMLVVTPAPKDEAPDNLAHTATSTPLSSSASLEKSSIVLEGPMYEPWNIVTIEKISSTSDEDPYEKIRSTYYRYGITAGRQIYERFSKQLTAEQNKEICWMLGQSNG